MNEEFVLPVYTGIHMHCLGVFANKLLGLSLTTTIPFWSLT
jgi:hypothetical protein